MSRLYALSGVKTATYLVVTGEVSFVLVDQVRREQLLGAVDGTSSDNEILKPI